MILTRHGYLVVLLLCGVPSATQNSLHDKQAGPPALAQGMGTDGNYRNESLGLTYHLPEGYSFNQDAVNQFVPNQGTRTLLVADQPAFGKPCINRLIVMTADTRNYQHSFTTKNFTANLVREVTSKPNVQLTQDVREIQLAGKTFYRANYRKHLPCGAFYQSLFTVKVRHFVVCWTLGCHSQKELEALVNSLQTISFKE